MANENSTDEIQPTLAQIHQDLFLISRTQIWESPHVWLTAEEMADLISSRGDQLSANLLKERAASGEIPGHKFPGSNRWRFNPLEVSRAIWEQGREGSGASRVWSKSKANDLLDKHYRRLEQRATKRESA